MNQPDPIRRALEAILREVGALDYHRPYSADSYLPEHLVQAALAAIGMQKTDSISKIEQGIVP